MRTALRMQLYAHFYVSIRENRDFSGELFAIILLFLSRRHRHRRPFLDCQFVFLRCPAMLSVMRLGDEADDSLARHPNSHPLLVIDG
jgi:hypothetical protein